MLDANEPKLKVAAGPPPPPPVVPIKVISRPDVTWLRYQVPEEAVAPMLTIRKVTVVPPVMLCKSEMVERSNAGCGFPVPDVTDPQVMGVPMFTKVPEAPRLYCH